MGFWTAFIPGACPRNEFAAPGLGNSASALLGSFNPVVTTAEAVAESAGRIVKRLKALNAEIKEIRTEIARAVDRVGTMEGGQAVGILRSVPGIGAAVLAVILSEAFDSIRKADLQALRCYFGSCFKCSAKCFH